VRRAISGPFDEVFATMGHQPTFGSPPPISEPGLVWGIEFVVNIEFCPPMSDNCNMRTGLRSVFVNYETGDFVQSASYIPPPGYPLPTG